MDYQKLFGKERIKSYNNIKEHNKNLRLIGRITPRLAAIELILRNKLDFYLSKQNEDWIFEEAFCEDRLKAEKKYKNHKKDYSKESGLRLDKYQYLSNLTLGRLNHIITQRKLGAIFAKDFKTARLDFKKLAKLNKDKQSVKRLPKAVKLYLILELLKELRNRSFHWENILKIDAGIPRIAAFNAKYDHLVSLHPRNIEYFLDFLLNSADKRV